MRKVRLGRTELLVTQVGFGGAPIGRDFVSEGDAVQAVWAAIEGGVNLIDTSPHYGLGRSEERIGRALTQRPALREGLLLSTKTGHYGDEKDYSYERTKRSVAKSLERLGVDYLDILHIHDVQEAEHLRELVANRSAVHALQELRHEGVIGNLGVGTKSLEVIAVALECGLFDCVMMANQYNLVDQSGGALIEDLVRADIGVLVAGAYATGILAKGSADPDAKYRYRPASGAVRARVAAIEELCARWDVALPAAAVQFCLRAGPLDLSPGVGVVLGARTAEQGRALCAAVAAEAPEGFWQEVNELLCSSATPA